MKIKNILFAEVSDTTFFVSFTYDEHILNTMPLPRTISKSELKTILRDIVIEWIQKRADDNFTVLKDFFEGKEISVDED